MVVMIAENQRDRDMIDIFTTDDRGGCTVWGSIHVDFFATVEKEIYVKLLDSDGVEVEIKIKE